MYKLHVERKGRPSRWLARGSRTGAASGSVWQVSSDTTYDRLEIRLHPADLTSATDVQVQLQRSADGVSGWTEVCGTTFGDPAAPHGWWLTIGPITLAAGSYRVWANVIGPAADVAVDGELVS